EAQGNPAVANHLLQAQQIRPFHPALLGNLITYSHYIDDPLLHKRALKELYQSGYFPSRLLRYYANVLQSVEEYGVLFVLEEEASWALWLLQGHFEFRPDVEVIGPYSLDNETYRTELCQRQSWQLPVISDSHKIPDDVRSFKWMLRLWAANPNSQVHMYGAKPNSSLLNEHQYLVGLTVLYSQTPVDNLALIKNNFEEQFFLDYLTWDLDSVADDFDFRYYEQSYLYPMSLLYQYYGERGDFDQAEQWLNQMRNIYSPNASNAQLVSALVKSIAFETIDHNEYLQFFATTHYPNIDFETLLDNMRAVGENLLASQYEATNKEYFQYLQWLKEVYPNSSFYHNSLPNYAKDYLAVFGIDSIGQLTMPNAALPEEFAILPVTGISWEAANSYCKWLSHYYNQAKDQLNSLGDQFRLPTAQEWELAAIGYEGFRHSEEGGELTIITKNTLPRNRRQAKEWVLRLEEYPFKFPWWQYYVPNPPSAMNENGCYLGNYLIDPEQPGGCAPAHGDGHAMLTVTNGFFPNEVGLYMISGNAAEMTAIKGWAKGGSWGHTPEESEINKAQYYADRDMRIGFRVFMQKMDDVSPSRNGRNRR
ncbi:MAG: SUMF1/EgtB/PvdO family nonheme iron enzyme, partial [Bacteroidota bacterium]